MKIHVDFGYFCWQFISVIQQNMEHDDSDVESDVRDIAIDESGPSMGFLRSMEEE